MDVDYLLKPTLEPVIHGSPALVVLILGLRLISLVIELMNPLELSNLTTFTKLGCIHITSRKLLQVCLTQ